MNTSTPAVATPAADIEPGRRGRKRTGCLIKKGDTYYLRVIVNGKIIKRSMGTSDLDTAESQREEMLAKLGVTARDSAEVLANVRDRLEHETDKAARAETRLLAEREQRERAAKRLPLVATWPAFLASKSRPDTGPDTLGKYKLQWDKFTEWLKAQEVERLAELTPDLADAFFAQLEKRDVSAGTFNKYLQTIRLVTSNLPKTEDIPADVFDGIRRKKDMQEVHKEIGLEQLWTICETAQGELKTLIFLGAYTGMRLKDCALLPWDEVDLLGGIIRHVPFKTASRNQEPLLIPLHPCLRAILEATPPAKRTGYVLPDLAAEYNKSNDHVTDKFQALLRKCSLPIYKPGTGPGSEEKDKEGKSIPGTAKRAVLQYGFHSLRHTAVTLLREAGAPQAVVAALVGHTSKAMTHRYTHVGEQALRAAVSSMPTLSGDRGNPAPVLALPPGEDSRLSQVRELAATMTGKNWRQVRDEIARLLA